MSDKPDHGLELDDVAPEPMAQFRVWYDDAEAEGIHLANAVALATADAEGAPMVRHVLLRGFDERGFVIYTNRESRKGRDLAANPRAAFALLWRDLDRQVVVTGTVMPTTDAESLAYFRGRPREARLGAWASRQGT
ncbi:MAG: pyridoxal 5'-phosphate synthase, partial [Actinomycetota bacterium]